MDEWISDEMTFLLGEQKASRETRSCWPFFKDSYNVFSYTHTAYTPGSSSSSCCPLCVSVLFCFFLYNGRWMAHFPHFSFASSFFLVLGTLRYLIYATYMYMDMYILYTVEAGYMPGISYQTKVLLTLPYFFSTTLTSANEE